ncbi:uncharacterized protein CXorf58-like isoform X2 [Tubulanus polymorphus]
MSSNTADPMDNRNATSRTSISVTLPPVETVPSNISPSSQQQQQQQQRSPTATTLQKTTSFLLSNTEVSHIIAVRMIERAWISFRDRQMFNLVKHAICAAEHSLSYEILRKISPKESEFCRDRSTQLKVRFRFGGREFPPEIYFKLYTDSQNGTNVNYISGKRFIKPASQAARDACDLMGNRKFYELILQDAVHHEQFKITDEIDVTTMKDYMQYLSHLDETPADRGGKDNSWRKLTLAVLPRTTIFYDIIDFIYGRNLSPRLRDSLPVLLSRPVTQDVQLQHIDVMSRLQSPPLAPMPTPRHAAGRHRDKNPSAGGRRSKQARIRALKMKKIYTKQEVDETEPDEDRMPENTFLTEDMNYDDDDDEVWEEEAHRLYEWSRDLTFDDLKTPRMPSYSVID